MKSFATSICPIKKSSRSEYEALGGSPAPSPRHPRAIPASSQRGETITQPISKRFLSGVITGLRHGDPSYSHLSGILAWQSVLLTGLWHSDLSHRYLRDILAWQSVLLSALWHGHPAHRCLGGIRAEPL